MTTTAKEHGTKVIRQEYHRNGIGGAGFIVSLVEWPEAGEEARQRGSHSSLFLAVSFFGSDEHDMGALREQTAVLNIGDIAEGKIEEAWRGADRVGPAIVEAWQHYWTDRGIQ